MCSGTGPWSEHLCPHRDEREEMRDSSPESQMRCHLLGMRWAGGATGTGYSRRCRPRGAVGLGEPVVRILSIQRDSSHVHSAYCIGLLNVRVMLNL